MQWAVNAYLLTLAALFAFGGRLADTVGHTKMVTLGVIVFAGASALCGLTPKGSFSEAWIVIFRAVQGVSAISSDDAWAVGMYSSDRGATDSTLTLRWNGKTWTHVPIPSPNPNSSGVNDLAGVSTVSPRSAFAAGYADDAFTGVNLSLILRWNGRKWSKQ